MDQLVEKYNCFDFIELDPISIPHKFVRKQDIEISGFLSATISWGRRNIIIRNASDLMDRMHHTPYDFVLNHAESDLKSLLGFKHRTFNDSDLLYFIYWLKQFYNDHDSLEEAFCPPDAFAPVFNRLVYFNQLFFSLPEALKRTQKHIQNPLKKSACKRLNMFLRWMVRRDSSGVDFGIWKRIDPASLIIPCDIHVLTVAHSLGMLSDKKPNWQTAEQLTKILREWDDKDPVRYDYALFGLGLEGRNHLH